MLRLQQEDDKDDLISKAICAAVAECDFSATWHGESRLLCEAEQLRSNARSMSMSKGCSG